MNLSKTRIFFATDIHGSEKCFRKFVNAGRFYKADVLILGGDITGKLFIPIMKHQNGFYTTHLLGEDCTMRSDNELEEIKKRIRSIGYYPYVSDGRGIKELEKDSSKKDEVFSALMRESVGRWVKIAEERLKGTGIRCFISPGNDDRYDIDPFLEKSDYVVNPEGKVVFIDDLHEVISCGCANITPWECPRDLPEEELEEKIEAMTSRVTDMKNCIFNMHCPPYGTNIDQAPKLDENMKPILQPGGGTEMTPAGCKSVSRAIEKYQPLLGLHGHIHESRGFVKLDRTLCINPGSEYSEGILRGFLVDLKDDGISDYMFTTG